MRGADPAVLPQIAPEVIAGRVADCEAREAVAHRAQNIAGLRELILRFLPHRERIQTVVKFTVISTKSGVGKTTLTANLGALLADIGLRVLMIDADVQPSLSKFLSAQRSQTGSRAHRGAGPRRAYRRMLGRHTSIEERRLLVVHHA